MTDQLPESCRPTALRKGPSSGEENQRGLIDGLGRRITYLRMSVTDRCDFRCTYCMAESMRFLPHDQLMSFEEAERIVRCFVSMGVDKVRITGGEPLVRKQLPTLLGQLSRTPGLRELALTTNGSQLANYAQQLRQSGVNSLNISLDSLRGERFRTLTRTGELQKVLTGIYAARMTGFERIRLNCVLMRGVNDDEILDLVHFAVERDLDIAFIEEMPLGGIDDRSPRQMSAEHLIEQVSAQIPLQASEINTGGPARYWQVVGGRSRIGLIAPHSNNFCGSCNRVRITARGDLYPCLGQDDAVALLPLLRAHPGDDTPLRQAILDTLGRKPQGHSFDPLGQDNAGTPKIMRFMSLTGG
jgi:cyclic pyranopterin phosphate synthase